MVLYLNHALDKYRLREPDGGSAMVMRAIHEGAVLRVRPKVMTVATIMAGLLPIMWGRQRFGGDATHRSPDDRWDGDCAVAVNAGYSCTL
jgi:Cu/Ag efflux pump CusA